MLDVDVQDIGCDFYAMTGHKLYGPTGIGVLYGKYGHLAAMRPFNGGGEMIREVSEDASPMAIRRTASRPARRPSSRRSGSAPRSTTSIRSASRVSARMRLSSCTMPRSGCARSTRCASSAPAKGKGPIVSFEMKGAHPHDVATIIDRSGVAVRAGTHCVMPLLDRFGVSATCRASFALYNTREEIDVLAQSLVKAREFFA